MSSYDEAVPHPRPDPALAATFEQLRDRRLAAPVEAVGDVVALVGSSRGGTSMLTELLRGCPGLLSLPGEMNPYVVVGQLAGGDGEIVRAELARAVGRPAALDDVRPDQLSADVHWRLTAQWPQLPLAAADVERWVAAAVDAGATDDLTVPVLDQLRREHAGVTVTAYDSGGVAAAVDAADATPVEPVVEMAPYVRMRPWQVADAATAAASTLVVAAPRNSFRLAWLRELFPHARVRVLHLTRNPAASVNGLIDGWQHTAFFSTPMPVPLRIPGYSDAYPWGERWWNFDVPPRWRELTSAPLAAVAAEQWRSAHEAVLSWTDGGGAPVLRMRYEDLVGAPAERAAAAGRLAEFLAVDAAQLTARLVAGTDPVMATAPPRQRRWAAASHDLSPALAEPAVWETAVRLGYEAEEPLWI